MAQLQSVDTARREMLANLSHDLRTPITTLLAHLESLQMADAPLDEQERREYVDVSMRQGRRIALLVEQLLEAAKLEAGQVTASPEVFPIGELLHDVVHKFALAARERGVALRAIGAARRHARTRRHRAARARVRQPDRERAAAHAGGRRGHRERRVLHGTACATRGVGFGRRHDRPRKPHGLSTGSTVATPVARRNPDSPGWDSPSSRAFSTSHGTRIAVDSSLGRARPSGSSSIRPLRRDFYVVVGPEIFSRSFVAIMPLVRNGQWRRALTRVRSVKTSSRGAER